MAPSLPIRSNARMPTVFFARHGHVDNPGDVFYGSDLVLSAIGRAQVRDAAECLASREDRPRAIVCSPWPRARESAEIYANRLGIPSVATDARLTDWDAGPWVGQPRTAFRNALGYDLVPPNIVFPPEVEALEAAGSRVLAAMKDVVAAHPEGPVLIVAHREPLVAALLRLRGEPLQGIRALKMPVGSAWRILLDAGGSCRSAEPVFITEGFPASG